MTPQLSLYGLFPPIPTPFDVEGAIDFQALEENFSVWNQEPLSGYVAGGSNGEFVHLTDSEKTDVVRFARQHAADDRLVIAGTGELSTQKTIEMTVAAAEAGAQAALVVTPYYYKAMMSTAALVNHYQVIAERVPIPIILYSVPANTGLDMPQDAVVELSHHPNIIGIKDSGGSVAKLGTMVAHSAPGFQVLAGSAGFFLGALAVGAVGSVAALANIAASRMHALQEAYYQGDLNRAGDIQRGIIEINEAITRRYNVPGLKAAMDMIGLRGGAVRPPLLALDTDARDELRQILSQCGLLPEL
ncbi:MAG: dihydrodipicolinate synthase family protein [Anaerolineales bacterium]|jgi:4-hydroxy-2-oxoglutarate aldolase